MRQETGAVSLAASENYCSSQGSRLSPAGQRQFAGTAVRTRAVTPEQILKSFNTRAFKRQKPDKPELMLQFVTQALARRAPIPFVMYWGKGLRPLLAAPEYACLNYLNSMLSRIIGIYKPGARLTLVFTDTHATLNGHSQAGIYSYFQDLNCAARERQYNTCLLSSLLNAPGLVPDEMSEPQLPPEEVLTELRVSAAKWFRGEGSVEEGAVRYFKANMLERHVIERAFPRSIFVTFNGSQLRSLFPDTLPIFYMFSLRHGVSDKPWFLPPDQTGRPPQLHENSIEPFRPAFEARDAGAP